MGRKTYNTEEERKAARKEYFQEYYKKNKEKIKENSLNWYQNNKESKRRYRQKNKEKIAEYYQNNKDKINAKRTEYRQKNKDKINAKRREYYQKNKEKILEQGAKWRNDNKEKIAVIQAEYRQNNKEKIAEYKTEWYYTKYTRAKHLLRGYIQMDRKNKVIQALNRGECTLTPEWIVDNIFSGQVCCYCGESDWRKLGADRKDSYLPHTPENCVPCCDRCNTKKNTIPYDIYMRMIGKIA